MIGNFKDTESEKVWARMTKAEGQNSSKVDTIEFQTMHKQLKLMISRVNDYKNLCLCSFLFFSKFREDDHEPQTLEVDNIVAQREMGPMESRQIELFDYAIMIEHASLKLRNTQTDKQVKKLKQLLEPWL